MRTGRWLVGVLAVIAVAGTAVLLARVARPTAPGPIEATPSARTLSVRVGDSVRFQVAAEGVGRFTWSVWGQPVFQGPSWTFVPGPEDAGWQQVTVAALGHGGTHRVRTWDVGVVPAVVPELTEMVPRPGNLKLAAGSAATFRCRARVAAARASDRLRVEWMVDDRSVLREERPAAAASTEMVLPASAAGRHAVRLRVTEDERTAALAEWTVEVAEPAPGPSSTVATAPRPRLVLSPARSRVKAAPGEVIAFRVSVEPGQARASFAWRVDGRLLQDAAVPRFDYVAAVPGRHRIAVRATVDGHKVGGREWLVAVSAPRAAVQVPAASISAAAPPAGPPTTTVGSAAPSAALGEDEVRRWLDDYARAWSRKDVEALQRMGQVRSAAEVERLKRYFRSIDDLHVDVRVLALRVDGRRASVDFERTDTVTDPAGQRRQLRLPPFHKEIERTPKGLRFAGGGGEG